MVLPKLLRWWLLAASSLTWFGCSHPAPRCQPVAMPPVAPAAPAPAPAETQPAVPSTGIRAHLLPPTPLPPDFTSQTTFAAPTLRMLHRFAVERLEATPGYVARLKRREVVDGKQRPEELILFKYRKDPASIHLSWLGGEAKGRELIWVKGRYDDLLHVLPGPSEGGLLHLLNHGVEHHPDGPRGLGKERGPVTQLGVAAWIERFGRLVDAVERRDLMVGTVKYLGSVKRPECDGPVEAVVHLIPPGSEIGLPKGGERLWYFDSTLHFPVLLITHDAQGQEVEYYCFDRFLFPGRFADEDFNPANLVRR
jgi:Protein of unknown function (DUF1571)